LAVAKFARIRTYTGRGKTSLIACGLALALRRSILASTHVKRQFLATQKLFNNLFVFGRALCYILAPVEMTVRASLLPEDVSPLGCTAPNSPPDRHTLDL
jgi:hypothetical protein